MDEKVEALASSEDIAHAPGSTPPVTARSFDINELQAFPEKKLKVLARDLDLYLHPARSRHQHILDIVRASLGGGATVTAEGFLDQVSDSFAMLRWPKLNFLPLPEDVSVPRALNEQYQLRPGQNIAGTVRLPGQREKFLSLNEVTSIEGQPAQEWMQPTHFDKLTPQFRERNFSRSEEHTSELQSHSDLVCRLLLEKKKQTKSKIAKIHCDSESKPSLPEPMRRLRARERPPSESSQREEASRP